MTVSQLAIKEFLERPLRDSEKAKRFTDEALLQKLRELVPIPRVAEKLRRNQKVAFLLCLKYKRYLPLMDMGTGKTFTILGLFDYAMQCYEESLTPTPPRMLVLVPNTVNVGEWLEQVEKHVSHLQAEGLLINDTLEQKREKMFSLGSIVVTTYQGLLSWVCSSKKIDAEDEDSKNKFVVDPSLCDKLAKCFTHITFDECTALKNHKSVWFKACKRLSRKIEWRFGLAGRPFGKNPCDLWSQFNVIDEGETLAETLGMFQAVFCKPKYNPFSKWPDIVFNEKMSDHLNRIIRHRSVAYDVSECVDLPERVRIRREVIFDDEAWRYREKLIEDLKQANGNFKLIDNVYLQMRQLSAGYLGVIDPEGDRITVKFKNNPKLDALLSDIQQMPVDRQGIVFNEYVLTGEVIEKALKDAKIKCVRLFGGTKDKNAVIEKFKNDPSIKILILQNRSGSMGLNLQNSNYSFFYETTTDPILRDQGEARNHRPGQSRTVFVYDYIVKRSIDEKIERSLASGEDLYQSIMRDPTTLT